MKSGDLLRHKRHAWLALALSVNERNMSIEFMWLDSSWEGDKIESCSMSLFEVLNESR